MELKVWVDDIQRIVCGVNPSTTCHDVVLALAVATGQTGRFTLIEKFQNNERLLSPSEKPFQILNKWAEYANDVQFIMKKSPPIHYLHTSNHNQGTPNINSPGSTHPVDSLRSNKSRLDSRMKHKLCNNYNNNEGAKVTISSSVNTPTRKKIESPSQQSLSCANTSQTFTTSPPTTYPSRSEKHLIPDLKSYDSLQSPNKDTRFPTGLSTPNKKYCNRETNEENRDLNGNTQKYHKSCSSIHGVEDSNQAVKVHSPITNGSKSTLNQPTNISRASIQISSPQKSSGSIHSDITTNEKESNSSLNDDEINSPRYVCRIELPADKSNTSSSELVAADRELISPRKGPRFAKLVEEVYNNSDDMNQAHFPIHHQTSLSSLNSRPRNPPSYNEALQRSSVYSSTSTSSTSPSPCFQGPERVNTTAADHFNSQFLKQGNGSQEGVGATGHSLQPTSPVRPSRKAKVPKVVFSPSSSQKTVTETVGSASKLLSSNNRIDPLRLMSTMQRNALIEEEIVESIELHEPQLKESILMKSKMKEMEKAWEENEAELEALEIEFKKKKERDVKNKEIHQLKEQSSELESKISFSKHQIQLLTDQIREEEHKLEMSQRKAEEEKKRKEMIEKLKNDIRVKEQEFEDQQNQLKQLDNEIKEVDEQIESKIIQVDVILGDIRKENLAGLSVEPSIQLQLLSAQLNNDSVVAKLHSEVTKGPTCENYFYNRIGSTRKMLGYPRELETAVATLKNPNGVWV